MGEINQDEQLQHLKELSRRNAGLSKQLDELLSKYEDLSSRDEQYRALLKEFGLEDEDSIARQGTRRYKMVSMLYVVVYGFDELTQCEDASAQLDKLDEVFFSIQEIAGKYNLLKIPTVGDNVLLAGGIKTENKTNPVDAAMAAIEIIAKVHRVCKANNAIWDVAIGIHTGPIIGRFVPKKTTPYTLAGNNVLTASRLGRAAHRGKILVSPMTFELVKEFFTVEKYGKIPVKYSGTMDIYSLKDIREELKGTDQQNIVNDAFKLSYKRLQFMDIQEFMLDKLEAELPKNLYYHNVKHTIDVTTEVELIGWAEGLSEEEIMLLKVAALFHDSGQIQVSKGHEAVSCQYVDEILPRYKYYTPEDFATIKRVIMATELPHTPSDILEAVIQDSDLDYLGRADFVPVSNMLYKELTERGAKMSINDWNKAQIKFISSHQYYTKTAQSLREVNKQIQIERLKESVEKEESAS